MNDKVTVLVPTYRRPELLCRTIQSILRQTHENLQVAIFDDASGDRTEEVVSGLSASDSRIEYYCHASNIGPLANHKYAFNSVDTPYFSIISDDDFLARDFLESAVNVLKKHPEVMFVMLDVLDVDENVNLIKSPVCSGDLSLYCGLDRFDALHSRNLPINWTAMVFRKEVAKTYADMDDRYDVAMDMRFLFYAAAKYNFAHLSKVGAFFTSHAGSASAARKRFDLMHHAVQISRYIEIFHDQNVDPYIRDRAAFYLRRLLLRSPYKTGVKNTLKGIVKNFCDDASYTDEMIKNDIMCFRNEGYVKTSAILEFLYQNNLAKNISRILFKRYNMKRLADHQSRMMTLQDGAYKEAFEGVKDICS